ncbi:secretion-regulating guanine nucleotide exchange factor [Anaeramoeba flamelloides]|uniref:Secretion-regulating guanine nucleotide exchange factor n=1 Tax=Anaeramoeba flamelloides TaxID=1746091 RepID=A0AAV7Y922_9EUKA|nr:secretion-regulating guanine nucleotide exchange factor [Anaeramoeba flamelloides]
MIIVCSGGNQIHFLVWKKPNKLEFYQKDNKKKKYQLPKNETIKDLASGSFTYQILTESGKVWSLANSNHYKEVPLLDADQSTFEEIRPVTFFEEKKLFVNSIIMGSTSAYYLCNGDQLYVSGSNAHGRLGIGQNRVRPDLLYACGSNNYGQLGVGSTVDQNTATAVENFKGSEILTLNSGEFYSVLITKKGQTYSCGYWRKERDMVSKNPLLP